MKQVLIFGDSNTWGVNPETKGRHPKHIRWPGLLGSLLGEAYNVAECGISGRTTAFDDPYFDHRNGRKALPYALMENMPIDILIISLGSNDLKFTDAKGSANGMAALLRTALRTPSYSTTVPLLAEKAKILVISPIHVAADIAQKRPGVMPARAYDESCRFAETFSPVCAQYGVELLDASKFAEPSGLDCIHMNEESHRRLAYAVFEKLKAMDGAL